MKRKKADRPARSPKPPKPPRARRPRPGEGLPPGFPYPCDHTLVGTRVSGPDFAGRVLGCSVPPEGKRGRYLFVGGQPVTRARVTSAMSENDRTRTDLSVRWSAPDYEPAARAPSKPRDTSRPTGAIRGLLPAPRVRMPEMGAMRPPSAPLAFLPQRPSFGPGTPEPSEPRGPLDIPRRVSAPKTESPRFSVVKAGDKGTCPACFYVFKTAGSRALMARHKFHVDKGQTRGREYDIGDGGDCFGSGREPFENSPEGALDYVVALRKAVQVRAATIRDIESGKTTEIIVDPRGVHGAPRVVRRGDKRWDRDRLYRLETLSGQIQSIESNIGKIEARIAEWYKSHDLTPPSSLGAGTGYRPSFGPGTPDPRKPLGFGPGTPEPRRWFPSKPTLEPGRARPVQTAPVRAAAWVPNFADKVETLAQLVSSDRARRWRERYPKASDAAIRDSTAYEIRPSRQYWHIRIGGRSAFAVDIKTGMVHLTDAKGIVTGGYFVALDGFQTYDWGESFPRPRKTPLEVVWVRSSIPLPKPPKPPRESIPALPFRAEVPPPAWTVPSSPLPIKASIDVGTPPYDGWQGGLYQQDIRPKQIAKILKESLAELVKRGYLPPGVKVSTSTDFNRLNVAVDAPGVQVVNPEWVEYELRNPDRSPPAGVSRLSPEGKSILETIRRFVNQYNRDTSDISSDYFNVHFYNDVNFGHDFQDQQIEDIRSRIEKRYLVDIRLSRALRDIAKVPQWTKALTAYVLGPSHWHLVWKDPKTGTETDAEAYSPNEAWEYVVGWVEERKGRTNPAPGRRRANRKRRA